MFGISVEETSDSIETQLFKFGSVVSAALAVGVLIYLLTVALEFGSSARQFPLVVLVLGVASSVALLCKEITVRFWKPDLLESNDEKVMENLTGSESEFPLSVRLKRLLLMGLWTGVFLLIASVDILTALVVAYAGSVYSLGVRDLKVLVGGSTLLVTFIYVVFVFVIQMPIDMFEVL